MKDKRLKTVRFRVGRTLYRIELPPQADAAHEIRETGFTNFTILKYD